MGRGGSKDRPTRNAPRLPPCSTANGHPGLAPSSTWRTEDAGAFNRWRSLLSLHRHSLPFSPSTVTAFGGEHRASQSRRLSYYRFSDLSARSRRSGASIDRDNAATVDSLALSRTGPSVVRRDSRERSINIRVTLKCTGVFYFFVLAFLGVDTCYIFAEVDV